MLTVIEGKLREVVKNHKIVARKTKDILIMCLSLDTFSDHSNVYWFEPPGLRHGCVMICNNESFLF